jgi:hypothetical protein
MDRDGIFDQLARHGEVFRALLTDLAQDEIRWKPSPEKWCALEIVRHLHDEEREDFRARVMHILDTPDLPMPKIDPAGWVAERKYMDQDFHDVLDRFLAERERSVTWLRGLVDAPWGNIYMHPKVGAMGTDLLLANWVAHDLHHIRQLTNLRYGNLKAHTTVPLDYAGTW